MGRDLAQLLTTDETSRTLVLVAHPDDEAILCGGTIARLAQAGCDVDVVCFSDGGQDRDRILEEVCAFLGAKVTLLDFPVTRMTVDSGLVGAVDDLVRTRTPSCVITHSAHGTQNQDHVALHQATRLAVGRWHEPSIVVGVEPPIASSGFAPNAFVDVSGTFDAKCEAVGRYREILDRPYMRDDYLRARAAWWGHVAGTPGVLAEAFELLLWRP